MTDVSRRRALLLATSLTWAGAWTGTWLGAGMGDARADETPPTGAMGHADPPTAPGTTAYRPSSQAARNGAARFETAHLIPGAGIDLARVDRTDPAAAIVALTLDDGPYPLELDMLEILAAERARATFFAIGEKVRRHPDITRKLVDAGHEVGCHSFSHPMMGGLTAQARDREFARSLDALAKAGVVPAWFRPPFGDWDEDLVRRARRFGMGTVTWNVDARDWKAGETARSVATRVDGRLEPAAVVLAHGTKAVTAEALPEILAEGRRRGLRFVTMGEWFATMTRLAATGADAVTVGQARPAAHANMASASAGRDIQ